MWSNNTVFLPYIYIGSIFIGLSYLLLLYRIRISLFISEVASCLKSFITTITNGIFNGGSFSDTTEPKPDEDTGATDNKSYSSQYFLCYVLPIVSFLTFGYLTLMSISRYWHDASYVRVYSKHASVVLKYVLGDFLGLLNKFPLASKVDQLLAILVASMVVITVLLVISTSAFKVLFSYIVNRYVLFFLLCLAMVTTSVIDLATRYVMAEPALHSVADKSNIRFNKNGLLYTLSRLLLRVTTMYEDNPRILYAWFTLAVMLIIFLRLMLTISIIIRVYSLILLIKVSMYTSAGLFTYMYGINKVSNNKTVKAIIRLDPEALKNNDSMYNIAIWISNKLFLNPEIFLCIIFIFVFFLLLFVVFRRLYWNIIRTLSQIIDTSTNYDYDELFNREAKRSLYYWGSHLKKFRRRL